MVPPSHYMSREEAIYNFPKLREKVRGICVESLSITPPINSLASYYPGVLILSV